MKPIQSLVAGLVVTMAAWPALADRINVASNAPVAESVTRLVNAVEAAGARVFTTVDFAAGARTQGETLRPTTIVIFGSPRIGSTALQEGQTMALALPLKVLIFEDRSGQVWATYDDPATLAPTHGIPAAHPAVQRMQAALARFVAIATGA